MAGRETTPGAPVAVRLRLDPDALPSAAFAALCPTPRDAEQERRARAQEARENFGKPGRDPVPVSSVVAALSDADPVWRRGLAVARLSRNWEAIVGKGVADHCTPVSLKDGVLTIRPTSTAWGQQLQLLSAKVARNVNEALGARVVRQVRVTPPHSFTYARGPHDVKGRGVRDTYG